MDGVGDFLGGTTDTKVNPASQTIDPYSTPGGRELASRVSTGALGAIPGVEANANAGADALMKAAKNPWLQLGSDLYARTQRGDFLSGSPEFRAHLDALRTTGAADAANLAARTRSQAALTGSPISTATLQALQAGNAAQLARTQAAQTGAIAQNQAMERQFQNAAPAALAQSLAIPGQFSEMANNLRLDPYLKLGGILQSTDRAPMQQGLDYTNQHNPGALDYLSSIAKVAGSVIPFFV